MRFADSGFRTQPSDALVEAATQALQDEVRHLKEENAKLREALRIVRNASNRALEPIT